MTPDHDPDAEFYAALEALEHMRWPEAADLFSKYVMWHPRVSSAWANLSIARWRLGETDQQFRAASKAFALDPSSLGSFLVIAQAHLSRGDWHDARRIAKVGLALFPSEFLLWEILAYSESAAGRHLRAIAAARRAIGMAPYFDPLMHILSGDELNRLAKPAEALNCFDMVLSNVAPFPNVVGEDPSISALRGKALAYYGLALRSGASADWRVARDSAHLVVQRLPEDVRANALEAVSRRRLGEFSDALTSIEAAITAGELDSYLALQRAMIYHELRRFWEAVADFDFALANANDPTIVEEILTFRPLSLIQLGEIQAAFASCDQALDSGVDNAVVRNSRGICGLLENRYEDASRDFQRAYDLNKEDPVPLANLGWIAVQQGNYAAGDALLDQALGLSAVRDNWGDYQVWVAKYLSLLLQGADAGDLESLAEQAKSSLAAYPQILERLTYRLEQVTLEHRLAIADGIISELRTTASSYVGAGRSPVESWHARLGHFERLLDDTATPEEELKQFLKSDESRFLFGVDCARVHTEHQFGSEFAADFVLEFPPQRYVLVELERASHRLYNASGNPSAALVHARQQVEDWQQWLEENNAYAQRKLPGCVSPEGLVIIGRRESLSDADRQRLARSNINTRGRIRVLTYDDLLDTAKIILANITGSAP